MLRSLLFLVDFAVSDPGQQQTLRSLAARAEDANLHLDQHTIFTTVETHIHGIVPTATRTRREMLGQHPQDYAGCVEPEAGVRFRVLVLHSGFDQDPLIADTEVHGAAGDISMLGCSPGRGPCGIRLGFEKRVFAHVI
jgi:hypothetical protein